MWVGSSEGGREGCRGGWAVQPGPGWVGVSSVEAEHLPCSLPTAPSLSMAAALHTLLLLQLLTAAALGLDSDQGIRMHCPIFIIIIALDLLTICITLRLNKLNFFVSFYLV